MLRTLSGACASSLACGLDQSTLWLVTFVSAPPESTEAIVTISEVALGGPEKMASQPTVAVEGNESPWLAAVIALESIEVLNQMVPGGGWLAGAGGVVGPVVPEHPISASEATIAKMIFNAESPVLCRTTCHNHPGRYIAQPEPGTPTPSGVGVRDAYRADDGGVCHAGDPGFRFG
jgi:hypothetical protein